MPVDFDAKSLLTAARKIAREAGDIIMDIYQTDFDKYQKSDQSPVTKADIAAEKYITPRLEALTPNFKVIAEEKASRGDNNNINELDNEPFWLVDPLDGTKEFIAKNGEFSVNIALIVDKKPFLGVVFAPASNEIYAAIVGFGAVMRLDGEKAKSIFVKKPIDNAITMITSKRHGDNKQCDDLINSLGKNYELNQTIHMGSSLKFCQIARGNAHIYPRFGTTCEWDTAAGQAILTAAGGKVTLNDGITPLTYAKCNDFINPDFIAWGDIDIS